jgi:hypothetical protein
MRRSVSNSCRFFGRTSARGLVAIQEVAELRGRVKGVDFLIEQKRWIDLYVVELSDHGSAT